MCVKGFYVVKSRFNISWVVNNSFSYTKLLSENFGNHRNLSRKLTKTYSFASSELLIRKLFCWEKEAIKMKKIRFLRKTHLLCNKYQKKSNAFLWTLEKKFKIRVPICRMRKKRTQLPSNSSNRNFLKV